MSALKRRDNKNRILQRGESQRKDGRYTYKYVDALGKTRYVYAWKLLPTDRTPKGKRDDLSLREKERIIQRDLYDGIDTQGSKMTLCQLYAKKNAQRPNVKQNTLNGRKYLMQALEDDILGSRSIDSIKPSDAREWAIRMKEKGFSYKTISNYKRSLKASFYMAIEDDYVRKNPFDFKLSEVIEDDSEPKVALSEEQEQALLDFMAHDNVYRKYYDDVLILLKTGLRISELCGLTKKDLDFENHAISVNHQLLKDKDGYYIDEPKTKSGIRKVPMSDETEQAFKRVLKRKQKSNIKEIDGYRNFLFLNKSGSPVHRQMYETILKRMVQKYNKTHKVKLPKITPHTLRHTFCTRLAQKNMNPKNLQYIMGHSNIMLTLNLYAHSSEVGANREMRSMIA
ncbi:tyrosine-type recombinase/integrase [Enterocloster aldenensis]|uniref:tyrosine-type recombinase/integrase n=1 Tax=Enterocloster aldenensis TaxID=358742 RepID=UPI004027485D